MGGRRSAVAKALARQVRRRQGFGGQEMFLEGGCTSSGGLSKGRRVAVLAAFEAAVDLVADGLGEACDFAILVHLMISDFVVITVYCGNCVTGEKKPKTYRRFLGTIFAESFLKRKGLEGNGLRMKKG
jgi:hypothetical protein